MNYPPEIVLDDSLAEFVERQVAGGQYNSPSEVVAAALRLLEAREKMHALNDALAEGEESGSPEPFDGEAFLERMHATHAG